MKTTAERRERIRENAETLRRWGNPGVVAETVAEGALALLADLDEAVALLGGYFGEHGPNYSGDNVHSLLGWEAKARAFLASPPTGSPAADWPPRKVASDPSVPPLSRGDARAARERINPAPIVDLGSPAEPGRELGPVCETCDDARVVGAPCPDKRKGCCVYHQQPCPTCSQRLELPRVMCEVAATTPEASSPALTVEGATLGTPLPRSPCSRCKGKKVVPGRMGVKTCPKCGGGTRL